MKKLIIALFIFTACHGLQAQETTIYNSPHNFEISKRRMMEAIMANGFKENEIRQRSLNLNVDGEPLKIVHFEFEDDAITSSIVTCEPTALLDMPFKMVLWEEEGEVFIGYVDTIWLRRRFLIKGCDDTLSEYSKILIRIANETIKSN